MLGGTKSRAQHNLNLLSYSLGTKYDFSKLEQKGMTLL